MAGKTKASNRIWIELEHPGSDHALGKKRAELATNVLRKLGDQISAFWWHETDKRYCITISTGGCYMTCSDHGHWFNLDMLGAA